MSAEQFFYEHAGYSYNAQFETAEDGRKRCARELAEAEQYARDNGIVFHWENDWVVGSHREFFGPDSVYGDTIFGNPEPDTCESCTALDKDGYILASLSCIDDADDDYRRVIEAELASEAMSRDYR